MWFDRLTILKYCSHHIVVFAASHSDLLAYIFLVMYVIVSDNIPKQISEMKKPVGAGIILLNDKNQILLILRDNNPGIPYPNMWDLPGGHVEDGENPEQAIRREMREELELELGEISLFKEYHHQAFDEYVFLKKIELDPSAMIFHEGQRLSYFNCNEIKRLHLAYSYDTILQEFFDSSRFSR